MTVVSRCGSSLAFHFQDAGVPRWRILDRGLVRIGRGLENEVVVPPDLHPMVSRRHVEFRQERNEWVVWPVSASSPTWLDGVALVAPTPIRAESRLVLGEGGPTVRVHPRPDELGNRKGIAIRRTGEDVVCYFEANRIEVGRDPHLPLSFPDAAEVSRMHAHLVRDDHGLQVIDSGSSNGVRVDGQVIQGAARLREGAVVEFGADSAAVRVATNPRSLQQEPWRWTSVAGGILATARRLWSRLRGDRRVKVGVLVSIVLAVAWFAIRPSPSSTSRLSERCARSVGLVCMEVSGVGSANRVDFCLGSCFLLAQRGRQSFLMTNAHVADPKRLTKELVGLAARQAGSGGSAEVRQLAMLSALEEGDLFATLAGKGQAPEFHYHVIFHDRPPVAARWVGSHETADLAILVADLGDSAAPALPVLPSDGDVEERVFAMGFSNGIEGLRPMMNQEEQKSLTDNPEKAVELLARLQQRDAQLLVPPVRECQVIQRSTGTVRFTGQVGHGHSGGPLLDADGRVVGVVTMGVGEAQDDKYAVSANVIRELGKKLGVLP